MDLGGVKNWDVQIALFKHEWEFCAAEYNALGAALNHRVDCVGDVRFGCGDDLVEGEFLLHDAVEFVDGFFFGRNKDFDAVAGDSVFDEVLFHRKLCADKADGIQATCCNRVSGGVGDVDDRNPDGLADDVIAFVRRVGAEQNRVGACGF